MSVRAPPPVDQLERGPPLLRGGASERGRGAAAVSVRRYDTVISGCRAVVAGAGVVDADVAVLDGRVAAVLGAGESVDAAETIDARGLYVLPGCVDSHTHWGYKGDFADQCRADSRAAALGGTTTVHLLHRATPGGIHEARRIAGDLSSVDFFMTPSVFDPQTAAQVPEWMDGEGHPSIKFYLAYRALESAPEGDDWNELDDGLFLDTLRAMSGRHGALACVHAENAEIINHAWPRARGRASGGLAAWEAAHPAVGEAEAIHRAGLLAESAEVPLYLVHLSGRASLEALARVRASWPAT
ncbi:MAG: hypothetical protein ACE5EV_05335, partial [Gaiellales bacterium]